MQAFNVGYKATVNMQIGFLSAVRLRWLAGVASCYAAPQPAPTIRQCIPVDESFFLTGVPADGSATYPIFTATVSRGVQTLSSATSYFDQWTYNR